VSIRFYMDVHVPYAMTFELRLRGVDVLTAQEDGAGELEDSKLLDRASTLGRVLVTQDADFLKEAARRQKNAVRFAGIICVPQLDVTIGQGVRDLELIARASDPEDWANWVEFLPLR
jgi:predicted nuclease of predicted toxin-antitoxin system